MAFKPPFVMLALSASRSETDALIQRAKNGDEFAEQALLIWHRERLKRMVASQLHSRRALHVNASDIVHDALSLAHDRLPEYLKFQPAPFYPWLRSIAMEIMFDVHRDHIWARRRSVVSGDRIQTRTTNSRSS